MTYETMLNYARDLDCYLEQNGIYTDWMTVDNGWIKFEIAWGDWKHEHGFADILVDRWSAQNAIRTGARMQQVIEENGSDCYSAIHMVRLLGLK